jgi:2Fe-2S ferredoxin
VITISVTIRSGEKRVISAQEGISVMEAIRDAGIDEIMALCGGCCSCATCHVYVDQSFAGRVTPSSEPETDLLSASEHRTGASRLSCQLKVTQDIEGLSVTIAPQE